MPISYDAQLFKQIQEISAVIRAEGCSSAYSCHHDIGECWSSLCGLRAGFMGQVAFCLKAPDMEIRLVCVPIANDNPEVDMASAQGDCHQGYKTAVKFINGTPDTLAHWHKEITSFAPYIVAGE